MTSVRYDRASISNYEKLSDGRLRVMATFSRVGDLQYLQPDGSTRTERVTADELFRIDSLDTAGLAPVTLGHPPEGMVTPSNWKRYAVGASGSQILARRNDGLVDVVFLVGDEEAIDAVESGKAKEVSAGYSTLVERSDDGTLIQTNRKYNHFALVPRGRAGSAVRLHLDSADEDLDCAVMAQRIDEDGDLVEFSDEEEEDFNTDAECSCKKDGDCGMGGMDGMKAKTKKWKGYELPTDAVDEITAMEEKMAAMGEAAKKMDSLQARVDSLEAERDRMDEQYRSDAIGVEAQKRLDTWELVRTFLPPDATPDWRKSPTQMKADAIKAEYPSLNLDTKSQDYVDAYFDSMVARKGSQDPMRRALDAAEQGGFRGDDADRFDAEMAEVAASYANRWKEIAGLN